MSTQSILIVEDDFLNRRMIKKVFTEKGYSILEAKNISEGLEILQKMPVDLAILDINLGENSPTGIDLGQIINDKYGIPFIYLTAYEVSDILNNAIITKPYSYITKPFKKIDLLAAVDIALRSKEVQSREKKLTYLTVKEDDYFVKIPFDEIDFIESDGNYLLINRQQKIYKLRSTVKQILEVLPAENFIQVHRAFIVNQSKVEKFSSTELIIGDNKIPVSKNFCSNMKIE